MLAAGLICHGRQAEEIGKRMDRRKFTRLGLQVLMTAGLGGGLLGGLSGCGEREGARGAEGRVPVKLGYLPITDHLLMIGHGFYDFQKVAPQPVKFGAWPEAAEALRAGAIDAAFLLTPLGLTLRGQGSPIKAALLGHRNGSVLTVPVGDRVADVADLAGKTIAIPSRLSTHYLLLRRLLAERNMDPEAVRYLDMAPPEMVQALASGRIDGFIVAEPFGGQAEIQQVGRVLILSKDIWPGHICCVLNIREEFIEKHPEAVQELVTGLTATGSFIEANRRQAAKRSVPYLGQQPEVIEHVLTSPADRATYHDLVPARDDFGVTQELMERFGLSRRKVNLDGYLEPVFARRAKPL